MVGVEFNPLVGHLGTWEEVTERLSIAKSKENPGTPLPISLRWLECVDDEMTALAVNFSVSTCPGFD